MRLLRTVKVNNAILKPPTGFYVCTLLDKYILQTLLALKVPQNFFGGPNYIWLFKCSKTKLKKYIFLRKKYA